MLPLGRFHTGHRGKASRAAEALKTDKEAVMVDYYVGHGLSGSDRWTYRQAFAAIAVSGVLIWAALITLLHFILA